MNFKLNTFYALLIITASGISGLSYSAVNNKFEKWLIPSYFRGYNIIDEAPKTLQDFIDFKNYGGNFFSINTRGFLKEDPPYDTVQSNIEGVDRFVNFCRQTGIYYIIAVRSGPGAYDTYYESQGWTPESRIWNTGNTAEQLLYANMLKMIVERYNNDTLFTGITFVVEPRPKVKFIPANNSALYKLFLEDVFNIRMDNVYSYWVSEVRSIDSEIPIILENFAYSTPELFPPYEIDDDFIIYSAHNYQPVEYTRPEVPFDVTYPGIYWNITFLSQQLFDSTFMANVIFGRLNVFAETSGKPVLLGEFGMNKPQNGGPEYIKDVLGTVKNRGWHFALWEWRNGGTYWSIENFQGDSSAHWKAVLKQFHAPPVPNLIFPEDNAVLTDTTPDFRWDSLTGFTTFDLELIDEDSNAVVGFFENISTAGLTYSGTPLVPGTSYLWRVRSKNPGGMPENNSEWSGYRRFTISEFVGLSNNNNIPNEFKLYQNYPNPFNPNTNIKYQITNNKNESKVLVQLKVYDLSGKEVSVLVNEEKPAGTYRVEFDATNLSSGVYYYRITAGSFTETKKMIVLK